LLAASLNNVIRFALGNRLLVAVLAVGLMVYGGWRLNELPIDVFPDLNRPRVVVMTEAHGMAPEEVETLITIPLETSLNGATGVQAVRSSSGVGISVIYVEFDWGTDIFINRQIVNERLALASERLPEGVRPQLAPISSIMGQIVVAGLYSETNDRTRLFREPRDWSQQLDAEVLPSPLIATLKNRKIELADDAYVKVERPGRQWAIVEPSTGRWLRVVMKGGDTEVHRATSPMRMRTLGDWVVRQQLLTIPGVSQVFVMGGERKQFQVLVNPDLLLKYGVSLHEVETAVAKSNENANGGYLDDQGPQELLVRGLGRIQSVAELRQVPVKTRAGKSIYLGQVAEVQEGPQVKRGDGAAHVRVQGLETRGERRGKPKSEEGTKPDNAAEAPSDRWTGGPGVILTINKQPKADTRDVTNRIVAALADIQQRLPADVRVAADLYQQKAFIDLAVANVIEALRDGGVLVVIILFLFLLNLRTTFITLTAIPLSIVVTGMVFAAFGLSINTMTLGGLAVAIGELVDDAIVDVENIYRRLKENRLAEKPKHPLLVVFQASVEIRNSIVFGTMIVVLVFLPLFALGGMEGRLFAPLGVAYIVSILSSLLVSLTVTPVLSYWLLTRRAAWLILSALLAPLVSLAVTMFLLPDLFGLIGWSDAAHTFESAPLSSHLWLAALATPIIWLLFMLLDLLQDYVHEGLLLAWLKPLASAAIRVSMLLAPLVLVGSLVAVLISGVALWKLESDFLPPFNEGAVQINVILPPGASLKTSQDMAARMEEELKEVPEIMAFVRRTGRAELDEHAEGVNVTEIVATLDPHAERSREEILADIRERGKKVRGASVSVEQPLAHLISHMVSGVKAQVAIKLYGDDLDVLRDRAEAIKATIQGIKGVKDLQVEPQVIIPHLRIEIDGERLKLHGLTRADVTELIETGMNGHVVSQVLDGQRTFDLLVRLREEDREDLERIKRLQIPLPGGGAVKLESVADIYHGGGPNTINREQVKRRIVVQCNVAGRGLVDVVEDMRTRLAPLAKELPANYFLEFGGQFESQQSASRTILILFAISLVGMFLVLYSMFHSVNLALQVMVALPMAFIGAVAALYVTDQRLTVAAMVGFISLCGIASRNGILLINHYLHLVKYEGEGWTRDMIVRAGRERLAPVLMTALTSGIGLLPLALAAGEPGKEILYPVATVIIGGLISSTALEFLVRPALFWLLGIGAARRIVEDEARSVELVEEELPTYAEAQAAAAAGDEPP